jgi:hypothetical protein
MGKFLSFSRYTLFYIEKYRFYVRFENDREKINQRVRNHRSIYKVAQDPALSESSEHH